MMNQIRRSRGGGVFAGIYVSDSVARVQQQQLEVQGHKRVMTASKIFCVTSRRSFVGLTLTCLGLSV